MRERAIAGGAEVIREGKNERVLGVRSATPEDAAHEAVFTAQLRREGGLEIEVTFPQIVCNTRAANYN
jgi:hypothetical protein